MQCTNLWILELFICYIGHGSNWNWLLFWRGPSPLTVFVLEELLVRRYANGGIWFCPDSSFKTTMSVNEKHLQTIRQEMNSFCWSLRLCRMELWKYGRTLVSRFFIQCDSISLNRIWIFIFLCWSILFGNQRCIVNFTLFGFDYVLFNYIVLLV